MININFVEKYGWRVVSLFSFAVFLTVFGVATLIFWKSIYEDVMISQIVLRNEKSPMYEKWKDLKETPYLIIHFFNWTNPETSLSKLEKPNFEEVGPYVFRVHKYKERIIWNNNDTISFRERRRYNFVPKLSGGSLHDKVTTINVMLQSIFNKYKNIPKGWKHSLNLMLQYLTLEPYVTRTVNEFLFQGYEDDLFAVDKELKRFLPDIKISKRFGFLYGKNVTEKFYFNMYTGDADENKLGLLHTFNYENKQHKFSDQCDVIEGSLGELWPKDVSKRDEIVFFVPDIPGSFKLRNVGSASAHDIDGTKFAGTDYTLDDGNKYKESKCYCPNNDKCDTKTGVRDFVDYFISFPHFYLADSSYRNAIHGMQPDARKHEFSIILQKDFGNLLDIRYRLQINYPLEPIDGYTLLRNVPAVLVPIFWYEGSIVFSKETLDEMTLAFNTVPRVTVATGLTVLVVGAALLLGTLMYIRKKNQSAHQYKI